MSPLPIAPTVVSLLAAFEPLHAAVGPLQTTIGPVRSVLVGAFVVVGSLFLTVGTVGLLRFDTVYNRMHATSKPTSVGVAVMFLASFAYFGPGGAGMPSLLGIVFLFLTIPTGTHMIARSAERMGVPFREGVTWPEPPGAERDVRNLPDAAVEGDADAGADDEPDAVSDDDAGSAAPDESA